MDIKTSVKHRAAANLAAAKQEQPKPPAEEQVQEPQDSYSYQPDVYNGRRDGAMMAISGLAQGLNGLNYMAEGMVGKVSAGAAIGLGALTTAAAVRQVAQAETTKGRISGALRAISGVTTAVTPFTQGFAPWLMSTSAVCLGASYLINQPSNLIMDTAKEVGLMTREVATWPFSGGDDGGQQQAEEPKAQ